MYIEQQARVREGGQKYALGLFGEENRPQIYFDHIEFVWGGVVCKVIFASNSTVALR